MPEHVVFRTKPQLVIDMLAEEIAAGTPFRYLCADSGHGRDPGLRAFCHERAIGYVMAVPVDLPLLALRGGAEPAGHALDRLPARGAPQIWERRSCGNGTKGERVYDWTALAVTVAGQAPTPGYAHTLLIRRSASAPSEVEFFLAHAPTGTAVTDLIDAAGMRWKTEEDNEHGKDLLGLTQYQAGSIAALRLLRLSLAAIRRVLARLFIPAAYAIDHVLAWSQFRRIHQTCALTSHYRQRGDPLRPELRM